MWKATDEARRSPESRVHFRRRLVERSLTLDLVFHTETFAFDDHRLGVMQQPIQDGGGQRVVLVEDLGPLLKGPVRGNNNCSLLIAQRDDLEEQISAGLVNGKVAEFIEDEQRGFRVLLKCLFETPSTPGGSKRVDDINGTGKEHR